MSPRTPQRNERRRNRKLRGLASPSRRALQLESLEDRQLLATVSFLPSTAFQAEDTAENGALTAALDAAARQISATFSDDVDMVADVNWVSTLPTTNWTYADTVPVLSIGSNDYDARRQLLVNDASPDESIVGFVPVQSNFAHSGPDQGGIMTIAMTRANMQAVGGDVSGLNVDSANSPGTNIDFTINFHSGTTWDYTRGDGITPGSVDFQGVATREILKGMGFISVVDLVATGATDIEPTSLDLFRVPAGQASALTFQSASRVLTTSPAVLYSGGNFDVNNNPIGGITAAELPVSYVGSASGGSLNEPANSWRDDTDEDGTVRTALGIMDPTPYTAAPSAPAFPLQLTAKDSIMMGLIGWDEVRTDFGDAPATYPVTLNNSGAYHEISSFRLGSAADREFDGQPSANADLDDDATADDPFRSDSMGIDPPEDMDDEDGVTFLGDITPGVMGDGSTVNTVEVTVTEEGTIDVWIDFDGDGSWSESGDKVVDGFAVNAGTTAIPFLAPVKMNSMNIPSFARVRLSENGVADPTGPGGLGEVEDNPVVVGAAPPTFQISDAVQVTEGSGGGTTTYSFTVELFNAEPSTTYGITVSTADDSAVAPGDYASKTQTLTGFSSSNTQQTFTVSVVADNRVEADEQFFVDLSNPTKTGSGTRNPEIGDDEAIGTINNDDSTQVLITDVSMDEGNSGNTPFVFDVTLTNPSDFPVSVEVNTSDGSATSEDYTAVSSQVVNFAAGDQSEQVTVNVLGDTKVEVNQTFNVNLSNVTGTGASIGDNQGVGTIVNDDNAVLSIAPVSQNEGNGIGQTDFDFTVTSSNTSDSTIFFDVTTGDITATAPSDYTAINGTTFSISPGMTSTVVTVKVNRDDTVEPNETFSVTIDDASGATISGGSQTVNGTILNDDSTSISIVDQTANEGNSGTTAMVFEVRLSSPSATTVTVRADTANGTATLADNDYTALVNEPVTFAPGDTQEFITVLVNGDTKVEATETLTVNLSNPMGASINDGSATGTITNDDNATISISDASVLEGNSGTTILNFTVSLSAASDFTISANASTNNIAGEALDGEDYVAIPGQTITFNPGETTKTFSVTINGDIQVEDNETFGVMLDTLVNVMPGDLTGVGTITNDDSASFSINDVMVLEGDDPSTANLDFTVTLSAPHEDPVTVTLDTADDTATVADNDYVPRTGQTLTFSPGGPLTQTFSVTVNGDDTAEATESMFVNLSNATGANVTISDSQGVGTITNDDTLEFSIDSVSMNEGNSGTTPFVFTVTLSRSTDSPVSVTATTVNGSAVAGSDFTANSTTLTFDPGDPLTQNFTVNVNGDNTVEITENFTVQLSNPTFPATISSAPNQGIGTIVNDDSQAFSIDDVTMQEGTGPATDFVFTVTLSNPGSSNVSVDVATMDDTATVADGDYSANSATLTFTPSGSLTQSFTVSVQGDSKVENNEDFTVVLSNPMGGASIADNEGVGSITDDDSASFSVNDVSQDEGNSGTTAFDFTVTLSSPVSVPVTVDVATSDDSATVADNDYVANSRTMTFNPGEPLTQTFSVTVNGDTTIEGNDTFNVNLSNVTGPSLVTISDGTGVGTIQTDDGIPITIDDVTVVEGDSGTVDAIFTVTAGADPPSGPITIDYATADDSATAGLDYVATSGSLTFTAAGSQTITVTVNGDDLDEPLDERFFVNLTTTAPEVLFVGGPQGIGTIDDDDAPVAVVGNNIQVVGTTGSDVVIIHAALADGIYITRNDFRWGPFYIPLLGEIIVDARDGDDRITTSSNVDRVLRASGGSGLDYIAGGGGNDIISGGDHDDILFGSTGDDIVNGDAGNDEVRGGAGNDVLSGGDGNDAIIAGSGNDIANGDAGDDLMDGDTGDDLLRGGDGDDILNGSDGNDILVGGAGSDSIYGRQGNDLGIGGMGADGMVMHDGDDFMIGGWTAHDNNDSALLAIMAELTSSNNATTRYSNVLLGQGLTGGNALNDTTVNADGIRDNETGGLGSDFFAIFAEDKVFGTKANDTVRIYV